VEQRPLLFELTASSTTAVQIVAPSLTEGMRKVKNFTLNLVPFSESTYCIFWALVYVPEGTSPGSLNVVTTSTSLYEPNQFVINCGIVDPDAGPIRFFSPLSRNLNSGDSIYLLVTSSPSSTIQVQGTARYAIAY